MKRCKIRKLRLPPGAVNLCGPRIRQARFRQQPRVSQDQLAACLGQLGVLLDRSALSRIENQQRGVSDVELKAIALCLRIPVDELLGDDDARAGG